MARPMTLLALVACAVAAHPPVYPDDYYSDSDSYSLWDDYDSVETTSAKVIIRDKPKVNVTKDTHKNNNDKFIKTTSDNDKFIKTTNISIQSHTNFIVTKAPYSGTRPVVQFGDQYLLMEAPDLEQSSTKKPKPQNRPRPISTPRPSTRRPSTRRPSTRRPSTTTRRPRTTPRRSTPRPKTTKPPKPKTTKCPPKKTGWFSSFFQQKKSPKSPEKTGWFVGFFSSIYSWIVESKSSWFGSGSWFQESSEPKKPNPTRTTLVTSTPLTTTPSSWFHKLIESEENDATYATNDIATTKKSTKKPLKKNYKGYQLIRMYLDVQWKVDEMLEFQEDAQGSGLMWWSPPSLNGSTDLLVPPDLLPDVRDHLKSLSIEYDVVIWDLQKAITYENPRLSKKQRLELEQVRGHPMTWRRYHRYADILRYLEYLHHSYSELVELVPLGRSSEGLPLVAVKISMPSNDSSTKNSNEKGYKKRWKLRSRMKPAVWIDGGTHAREWIAPAVATWMLHSLVEGETKSGSDMDLLEQADFYIMPVLNPDGYEHSHTYDRLWRKTRSRASDHDEDYYTGWFPWNWGKTECMGVDADRNWDYRWGEQDSSRDPCMDNYAGSHPFSEPETRAVSEFLAEHRGQIKVFISLHAYSQAWLVPSSHAQSSFTDDGLLMEMGKLATAALADSFGTKYRVGTVAELRQPASGMSHDWAKSRAGIKYSYHVDLRDSFGPYGFLLPGSQIVSTARETWQAIKAIVDNIAAG